MSNKIAGPIYRIQKDLNSMNCHTPIRIRSHDYFHDLVTAINHALLGVKERKK